MSVLNPFYTELNLGGTWTDISPYIYQRDGVTVVRGRRDESSIADVSTATYTLNNRDGRFSPRNPLGAYYGQIGRNTPLRTYVTGTGSRLVVNRTGITSPILHSGVCSCPDSVALSITGDIDVRADASVGDWSVYTQLAQKYDAVGQASWILSVSSLNPGVPYLWWSADGTNWLNAEATTPIPAPLTGRRAIRMTLDVNNGAGGRTITWYTAPTISGPWTQLGDPVVQAGTTSIFDSTSRVVARAYGVAEVYAVEVRNGIGGTVVANPDFTAQTDGATSFADGLGNTWTTSGQAEITTRRYRFHGEVSSWPQAWDVSGHDVYTQITASGILRRLAQGTALRSCYYRGMTKLIAGGSPATIPVAYWPLEDAVGSTTLASGLSGFPAMTISGTPTLASSTAFVASAPLPVMANSAFTGSVPAYVGTGSVSIRWLCYMPTTITNGAVILRAYVGGSASRWDVVYGSATTITVNAYDGQNNSLLSQTVAWTWAAVVERIQLDLVNSGSNVSWTISGLTQGKSTGGTYNATLSSQSVYAANKIVIDPNSNADQMAIGHVTVLSYVPSIFDQSDLLNAYSGERAGVRMARLCDEEGISFLCQGAADGGNGIGGTTPMGYQSMDTLLSLLRECESADHGILTEPREFVGLIYRTRDSMATVQGAQITANYASADLSSIQPTDDDLLTRNDITVDRKNGSSARKYLASGTMSVQAPPTGVGTYSDSRTLNVYTDGALPDHASWLLHMGTIDEARYPTLGFNLLRSELAGALGIAVRDAQIGDLLVVTNPPAWMPPESIRQIIQGFTERLNSFEWVITPNCAPASAYDLAIYGDSGSRYSSQGSQLHSSATSGATSLSVDTTSGQVWTTNASMFPFDIMVGGERMTVTNITGTSSPQTFTVTRAVNGIVKAHSAGESVNLFRPVYYALGV